MRKLYILGLIALAALIIGLAWADQMILTTYYPAPYGVYNDMAVMNRLGIGTTAPGEKLTVSSSTVSERDPLINISTTADGDSIIQVTGDRTYSFGMFGGSGGDAFAIKDITAGEWRFFMTSAGNVGIGDSDPSEAKLVVNGTAGNFTGVWSNLSDRRLKKDIQSLEGSLSKVLKLQGVSFYWKDSERGEGLQRGFISQDVEHVIPEWVKTDDDGYKRLEKVGVEALLVEAIKELNAKVESLEAHLNIGQ